MSFRSFSNFFLPKRREDEQPEKSTVRRVSSFSREAIKPRAFGSLSQAAVPRKSFSQTHSSSSNTNGSSSSDLTGQMSGDGENPPAMTPMNRRRTFNPSGAAGGEMHWVEDCNQEFLMWCSQSARVSWEYLSLFDEYLDYANDWDDADSKALVIEIPSKRRNQHTRLHSMHELHRSSGTMIAPWNETDTVSLANLDSIPSPRADRERGSFATSQFSGPILRRSYSVTGQVTFEEIREPGGLSPDNGIGKLDAGTSSYQAQYPVPTLHIFQTDERSLEAGIPQPICAIRRLEFDFGTAEIPGPMFHLDKQSLNSIIRFEVADYLEQILRILQNDSIVDGLPEAAQSWFKIGYGLHRIVESIEWNEIAYSECELKPHLLVLAVGNSCIGSRRLMLYIEMVKPTNNLCQSGRKLRVAVAFL